MAKKKQALNYVVSRNGLNVRSGPDFGETVLCILPHGAQVSILDTAGDWSHINYLGLDGYVLSQFLAKELTV